MSWCGALKPRLIVGAVSLSHYLGRVMIQTPYKFEAKFSDKELQKLGQFALRWSHIEHTVANCLRVLLGMQPKPATIMVFPLSLHDRMDRIGKLDKIL